MEPNFWHERWEKNQISFHLKAPNSLFVKYFQKLALAPDARVFLPLCGKTLDIHWLLSQGYTVVGAELSELAIIQLFEELGLEPEIKTVSGLKQYSAPNIDIFVGNFFDVTSTLLGPVDAIYDRAALVALPLEMRVKYTTHLIEVTQKNKNAIPQLLICFEYDQSIMDGPPFSISEAEVKQHYSHNYSSQLLESIVAFGDPAFKENAWLLMPN
jgi:thiopurine S-methyltransferase